MNEKTQSQTQQAIIYCRVSSKAQEEEGNGLKSQETRCREYAASKGYAVAAVFPDTFTGGGDFMQRPGMVALFSFLDAQPETSFVVIFDDLKRFARDTRFHLDLREAFRKRRASIECLNFKFDDTPEGEFIETIMAAQGALERKQNGRQVAQKMKARMQNGYWVHNAPIGYRYKTVKGHGKLLVRDEPMATLITDALEGFASGRFQTQAEVTRFLAKHPDFPRNRYGDVKLQKAIKVITQPLYAGYICSETYGLNWVKGQHDALISMATYERVQDRRKAASLAPARKNIGDDFALRGFVCCADCGNPYRSSWAKGKKKHYAYYLCQTKGCANYGKSIPRDTLEKDFGEIVKSLQPSKSVLKLARDMFRHAWEARLSQSKDTLISAKRQLADIEDQIDKLLERILDATNGRVIAAYEEKIAQLEKSKASMVDHLAQQGSKHQSFDALLEHALRFLANPWKLWESGDITLRRMVLRLAFADRFEYHRIEGARTPQIALPFKALRRISVGEFVSGAAGGT